MRSVPLISVAVLVVYGCDGAEPSTKSACSTSEQCADDRECVAGLCVEVFESAGGGAGGGVGGGSGGGGGGRMDSGMDAGVVGPMDAGMDAALDGGSASCAGSGVEACNGIDDDCDGVTDPSSCPWYFGEPMPVVELHVGLGEHLLPYVSPDGSRIYYGALDSSGPTVTTWMASRASARERFLAPSAPGEPFRAPTRVEGLGDPAVTGPAAFSGDELEPFVQVRESSQVHFDIARRTRSAATGVFVDRGFVPGASRFRVDEMQPFLSRDGRELFFSANPPPLRRYRLFRIARDESGELSGDATELTLMGSPPSHADWSPFLAEDGETLLYEAVRTEGEGPMLMRAVRDAEGDPTVFTVAGILPIPDSASGGDPFVSERTSELFFVSGRFGSPAHIAIHRMRICREAPCPAEDPAPCPTGAATTVRSASGRHCYGAFDAGDGFEAARATCASAGATLASVHSALEAALLVDAFGGGWLGAIDAGGDVFAWDSGEPFLYAPWDVASPVADSGCVSLAVGPAFVERDCTDGGRAICEIEHYPTW
jgi:hypothetical protein